MKKLYLLITLLVLAIVTACKSDNEDQVQLSEPSIQTDCNCIEYMADRKENNLNISLFLDLSDRIKDSTTVKRDIGYIKSTAAAFNNHVKRKRARLLHDYINVYFDPEPTNNDISSLANDLDIEYCVGAIKNDLIAKSTDFYSANPPKIYELALDEGKVNGFPGSNIYRFFQDHVKDYAIKECSRNILIVLTDGYMYDNRNKEMVKGNRTANLSRIDDLKLSGSDWKSKMKERDLGYIPATTELGNLEVIVLGIDSKSSNSYGQDILEEYWKQWLVEMDVNEKNIKIEPSVPIRNMERIIDDFLIRDLTR